MTKYLFTIVLFLLVANLVVMNQKMMKEKRVAVLKEGECFLIKNAIQESNGVVNKVDLDPKYFYKVVKKVNHLNKRYEILSVWKRDSDNKYHAFETSMRFGLSDFKYNTFKCPHLNDRKSFSRMALLKLDSIFENKKDL